LFTIIAWTVAHHRGDGSSMIGLIRRVIGLLPPEDYGRQAALFGPDDVMTSLPEFSGLFSATASTMVVTPVAG
jgi:hypothetical protein